MNIPEWLLSKKLWYGVIYSILLSFFLFFYPFALEGGELATNFLAEIFGLLFTFAFFTIVLEARERLERKPSEDKAKRRIGRVIQTLFLNLSVLCEIEMVQTGDDLFDHEAIKKQKEKQLNSLTSGEIKLDDYMAKDLWKDKKLALNLASYLESKITTLSEMEDRYYRFLDSDLQASLMDIQDYLHSLSMILGMPRKSRMEEGFYKSLSDLLGKIMVETAKMRRRGIDIGF